MRDLRPVSAPIHVLAAPQFDPGRGRITPEVVERLNKAEERRDRAVASATRSGTAAARRQDARNAQPARRGRSDIRKQTFTEGSAPYADEGSERVVC